MYHLHKTGKEKKKKRKRSEKIDGCLISNTRQFFSTSKPPMTFFYSTIAALTTEKFSNIIFFTSHDLRLEDVSSI